MEKHLFPREIIEYSSEYHIWKNTISSQVLYSSVVIVLISILLVLPYLRVDVSVSSRGIIRPVVEKNNITSLVSGKIVSMHVRENARVTRGDTIAIVESSEIQSKILLNMKRRRKLNPLIHDLKLLARLDSSTVFSTNLPSGLQSPACRQSFIHFQELLANDRKQIQNKRRIFRQNEYLYRKKALSKSNYQESEYNLFVARNTYNVQLTGQIGQWQLKLDQDQKDLDQLVSTRKELLSKIKQYTLRAPVTGTIQNLNGLSEGSYLYPNQKLAEISPDTGLIAECYVTPGNIGMLRIGMTGRFQIDAFNYNQWGTINGRIVDISNDVSMITNQPVFKVRCRLNQPFLELANGFRGYVKKGMTLQGRFIIARRSLLQLLYDRVDDWLNPVWNSDQSNDNQTYSPAKSGDS
ncbi:MAG TPA: HlyD family efflux transporter periplasmic adaptor subunit [Balneolales bacterium]|nr:HlyD family efflux transporter periplasmic adaptor subunit [Balneolales bacterium]